MKSRKLTEPMSGTRTEHIEGIIIRSHPFGEGHTRFSLIDRNFGKVDLIGFGAGKEKSRRRSSLLTGNLIRAVVYRKDEETVFSLRESDVVRSFDQIRSDLNRMAYLFLILEILDLLIPENDPFPAYRLLINILDKMEANPRAEKYAFFLIYKLMRAEGIFPEFSNSLETDLFSIAGHDFNLGSGSLRFLKDSQSASDPSFWDHREISSSVIRNLLDLFNRTVRFHYMKDLKSISLIPLRGGTNHGLQ